MKVQRFMLLLCVLVLALACLTARAQDDGADSSSSLHHDNDGSDHDDNSDAAGGDHGDAIDTESDEAAVLQVNPDYVEPSNTSVEDGSDDDADEHDVDEDEDEDEEATVDDSPRRRRRKKKGKRAIQKALSTTNKRASSSSRLAGVRRRTVVLIRKHGLVITLGLAVYAFRKELRLLLWRMSTQPVQNPETGEWVRVPVPISVTAILKLIIFIDVMRRIQQFSTSSSSPDGPKASPLLALLLAGGAGRNNPFMAMLLSKLLESPNTAYVPPVEQHYTFERVNNRYNKDADALRKVMASSATTATASLPPSRSSAASASSRRPSLFWFGGDPRRTSSMTLQRDFRETIVVLDWTNLDTSVSQLNTLRDQVSFLISQYRDESWSDSVIVTSGPAPSTTAAAAGNRTDAEATAASNTTTPVPPSSPSGTVLSASLAPAALKNVSVEAVVLLESPGGSAGDYGLAAQQILRLRRSGMKVTICVDKVAASGGYMIASCASPGCLFAAPLAIVGSIGVIGQSLNVHKTLKGWGVEPLVFRGGRDKAPVGLIGEVTREGMQKVQAIVDNTHRAFKKHVAEARPVLSDRIEELATGDIWLGYDAIDIGLVDRLVTSDEYLEERLVGGARVLKLTKLVKPRYPFARPTTTTQEIQSTEGPLAGLGRHIAQVVATECQQFVQRLSDVLLDAASASDDPVAIARAVRATASSASVAATTTLSY